MWPWAILATLVVLGGGMLKKRKPTSTSRWDELADSAIELEHHTGRVKYELRAGTQVSLLAALRKLNGAIARAPQHPQEFTAKGSEAKEAPWAIYRREKLDPALYHRERAIDILADMKARGVKKVANLYKVRAESPPSGIRSTADRQ